MPAANILIKPASSACNINCSYCFYKDIACNRENAFEGMMSLKDMEKIISAAMEYAEGSCSFAFQGGEPTLAGLDFYQNVIRLQKHYAKPGVTIHNSIQTNGLVIDDAWAKFFSQNHFLVGISLDGPAELHNLNRKDIHNRGTWNRVMRTIQLFNKYQVDYNVLCVVTGQNARSVQKIYQFYKKQGFRWLQFIPCLEPLGQNRGAEKYHLSCQAYGNFLITLFDLWYEDLKHGTYISIRHLDNWLSMLMGNPPESCGMSGQCAIQFVVEGNGGVYPCDFYVLDEWCLGKIGETPFQEMLSCENAKRFCQSSCRIPEVCKACPVYPICRNGCRRDRLLTEEAQPDRNYYCEAYRRFFMERYQELSNAARILWQMHS